MSPIEQEQLQRQQEIKIREKIRMLFSAHPEVRLDAQEALKAAWSYDQPSFRMEELAAMPADNCTIAAARRDGAKEVIDWLLKL